MKTTRWLPILIGLPLLAVGGPRHRVYERTERPLLDAALASSLGLEEVGTQHALGSGGSAMGSTVRGVDVALPGFELKDQTMGTLALGAIAAQSGRPLDGVLGHPLFARCVVEIDYPRRRMILEPGPDLARFAAHLGGARPRRLSGVRSRSPGRGRDPGGQREAGGGDRAFGVAPITLELRTRRMI